MTKPETPSNLSTPVTIFTGFLGSGKTTIISHLIDELQAQGVQLAYVKNEVGETDVDASLMLGKNLASKALLNGCICCTLTGPFEAAIDELIDSFHPDRIIIESAGTADPASLALLVTHHQRVRNDGLITVIDVVNFDGYADLSLVAQRQAEFTDLIVFNKVELVTLSRKQSVVGYVRELQATAPIVEAVAGRLDPELVTGITITTPTALAATHNQSKSHLDHDQIEAKTILLTKPVSEAAIKKIADQLPANVIRWKGVVEFDTGWKVINGVLGRVTVEELPLSLVETLRRSEQGLRSYLLFMGYQLEQMQIKLE